MHLHRIKITCIISFCLCLFAASCGGESDKTTPDTTGPTSTKADLTTSSTPAETTTTTESQTSDPPEAGEIVVFTSAFIADAIREELSLKANEDITTVHLDAVVQLNIWCPAIIVGDTSFPAQGFPEFDYEPVNLSELTWCKNLQKLALHGGYNFVDLKGILSQLGHLTDLCITANDSVHSYYTFDCNALTGIDNLKMLCIASYFIGDVQALAQVESLKELCLYSTFTDDLTPFAALNKLEILKFCEYNINSLTITPFTNISALQSLTNLKCLAISVDNADLSPLESLKNLSMLTMANSKIRNMNFLSEIPHLTELALANTAVTQADINPVAQLEELVFIYVSTPNNIDFSGLLAMPSLVHYYIKGDNYPFEMSGEEFWEYRSPMTPYSQLFYSRNYIK